MNKYPFFKSLSIFLLLLWIPNFSFGKTLSFQKVPVELLASFPVQAGGRVKPLETFARSFLKRFSRKDHYGSATALQWLFEVLLKPGKAQKRPLFAIKNPDLVAMLGLKWVYGKKYTFQEVFKGFQGILETTEKLIRMPARDRTSTQNQLVAFYFKVQTFLELSRSFSFLFPKLVMHDVSLAKEFQKQPEHFFSYWGFRKSFKKFYSFLARLAKKKPKKLSSKEQDLVQLFRNLEWIYQDRMSHLFSILPLDGVHKKWHAFWELLSTRKALLVQQESFFQAWEQLYQAYQEEDVSTWSKSARTLWDLEKKQVFLKDSENTWHQLKQKLSGETFYQKADFFQKSFIFYLIALFFLGLQFFFQRRWIYLAAVGSFSLGVLFHFTGVGMRVWILGRPPVSTLYESILFVSLVIATFGGIYERWSRSGLGIFLASLLGVVFHLIGFSYALEGDTMGVVVAVLNTNFWLLVHVLTITTGYGSAFLVGALAHVWLIQKFFKKESAMEKLYWSMIGMSAVALFFSVLGTILGGVWADQSWGRFWGWDPKENGALLLVLWLLVALHGRFTKIISTLTFMALMAWTNIVVVLAWFGVNLLNIGLHSYGFTQGVAKAVLYFSIGEVVFVGMSYGFFKWKKWREKTLVFKH